MEKLSLDSASESQYALTKGRAVQRGFRGDDLDDAVQQAMSEIIQFKFDPTRSNGAKESTALTAIIDRQLNKYRRGCGRHRTNLNKLKLLRTQSPDPRDIDLQMDVRAAIAGLPPQERSICEKLAEGKSIREIAREQRCGWHTANQIVIRIRDHFNALGLRPTGFGLAEKGA